MSSLKLIRSRIRSVNNTKKISQTMKVVSAAKFSRAEKQLKAIRPFGYSPQHFFTSLDIETSAARPNLIVTMSGDRGLCGAIHSGIAKAAIETLENHSETVTHDTQLFCVGEKNRMILSRIFPEKILWVATEIGKTPPTFIDAALIATKIMETINEHVFIRTQFYFNKFISAGVYQVSSADFYNRSVMSAAPKFSAYDMVHNEIIDSWLEFAMAAMIFWILNEGAVSELSARMTAMEGATKNATEMIKNLNLEFNRTRQAVITKELIEIISGASTI